MNDESNPDGHDGAVADAAASWGRALGHLSNSVLEANRAAAAAFTPGHEHSEHPGGRTRGEWSFERSVDRREDIGVGDTVRFTKRMADADVHAFAEITGDTNRLHLDDEFAAGTRFGGRIVHGTLVSGTISAALARLPGLTIYLSQDVQFQAPVDVGGEVTAVCEVVEDLGDDRYRLTTRVLDEDEEVVIDGEAIVLVDERPDDDAGPA